MYQLATPNLRRAAGLRGGGRQGERVSKGCRPPSLMGSRAGGDAEQGPEFSHVFSGIMQSNDHYFLGLKYVKVCKTKGFTFYIKNFLLRVNVTPSPKTHSPFLTPG